MSVNHSRSCRHSQFEFLEDRRDGRRFYDRRKCRPWYLLPDILRQLLVSPLCLVKSSSLLSLQPAEWSAICPSIFVQQKLTSAQKWQRGSLDILSSYSSLID